MGYQMVSVVMGSFRLYIPIFRKEKKKVKIIYYKKLLFFYKLYYKITIYYKQYFKIVLHFHHNYLTCFSGDMLMLLLEVRIFICSLQLSPKGEWRDRQ